MIDYIKGKVSYSCDDYCIVEIDDIGIKIFTPYTIEKSPIYTKLLIKDEVPVLYGFKTKEERDLFEKLISITGIGVKHAMSMIKHLSAEKIIEAIENKDISILSSVPGIGKKTAQRLIFELQGKIDFYQNEIIEDAVNALLNLGFDKISSIKAVREFLKKEKTTSLEEVIKGALKLLSK